MVISLNLELIINRPTTEEATRNEGMQGMDENAIIKDIC